MLRGFYMHSPQTTGWAATNFNSISPFLNYFLEEKKSLQEKCVVISNYVFNSKKKFHLATQPKIGTNCLFVTH